MQSILLTTSSKVPVTEQNSETKIADAELNVDGKGTEEKVSPSFSALLENMIAGELATEETELVTEELSDNLAEESDTIEFELEGLLVEDELSDDIDAEPDLAFNVSELEAQEAAPESVIEEEVVELDLPIKQDELLIKSKNSDSDGVEKEQVEAQKTPVLEKMVSPILAQIEIAQKTDTKVNEAKMQGVSLDVDFALKDNKKSLKVPSQVPEKSEKLSFENVLSDEGEVSDELLPKESLRHTDKLDNIISSLKTEIDKPMFNQPQESSGLRPVTTMGSIADKQSIQATNNNLLMQSATLQQPIELQAKHASAMMGERIMMMIGQGKQEVTIRLDPAELGSMHIKLQVQQDQLQVAIQTQVGQSRDIIEQHLPRLREQLAQQGINLGEASVEQQSKQQQSDSPQSQANEIASHGAGKGGEPMSDEQEQWLSSQIPLSAQGIDYYA